MVGESTTWETVLKATALGMLKTLLKASNVWPLPSRVMFTCFLGYSNTGYSAHILQALTYFAPC